MNKTSICTQKTEQNAAHAKPAVLSQESGVLCCTIAVPRGELQNPEYHHQFQWDEKTFYSASYCFLLLTSLIPRMWTDKDIPKAIQRYMRVYTDPDQG